MRNSIAKNWSTASGFLLLALLLAIPVAYADVRLEGTAEFMRLQLQDASLQDAFGALSERYPMRIRSSTPLDVKISRNVTGPLEQVLARLLDGYDFVVRRAENGVTEVLVLGSHKNGPNRPTIPTAEKFSAPSAPKAERRPSPSSSAGSAVADPAPVPAPIPLPPSAWFIPPPPGGGR